MQNSPFGICGIGHCVYTQVSQYVAHPLHFRSRSRRQDRKRRRAAAKSRSHAKVSRAKCKPFIVVFAFWYIHEVIILPEPKIAVLTATIAVHIIHLACIRNRASRNILHTHCTSSRCGKMPYGDGQSFYRNLYRHALNDTCRKERR